MATQKSTLTPVPLAVILTTRPTREGETAWRRDAAPEARGHLPRHRVVGSGPVADQSDRHRAGESPAVASLPAFRFRSQQRQSAVAPFAARPSHRRRHDRRREGGPAADPTCPCRPWPWTSTPSWAPGWSGSTTAGADLLGWAAILGDGQSLTTLQTVSGCDDDEFDRLMGLAGSLRLLYEEGEIYRFDHPELREVLYARLPGRQRRRRHLAAARRLEEESARGGQEARRPDRLSPVAGRARGGREPSSPTGLAPPPTARSPWRPGRTPAPITTCAWSPTSRPRPTLPCSDVPASPTSAITTTTGPRTGCSGPSRPPGPQGTRPPGDGPCWR